MLKLHQQPYIQKIRDDRLKNVKLFIKREDVIHPYVSGNKWRKLKYNLLEAKGQGHHTLLTFGGAYSNHIYATAAAAKEAGFKLVGIVRGDELKFKPLNSTLEFADKCGMQLEFVDRDTYRKKKETLFINTLKKKFGPFYLVPEGGTNALAIRGTAEIVDDEVRQFDYVCCSVGTGGTIAGLIYGMQNNGQVFGFSALKGSFLTNEVDSLLGTGPKLTNWNIFDDYHFGGYAKTSPKLLSFIQDFERRHRIPIEPIYTGKMLFGVFSLLKKGFFESGAKILVIHTGGLRR
ncbi:MAG: pyridoxal-phosphate dependent enzyme [Bacteroidota bacterium]